MLGKAFALQANELLNALGELLVQAFVVVSAVDESGAIPQGLAKDPLHGIQIAFRHGMLLEVRARPCGTRWNPPGTRWNPLGTRCVYLTPLKPNECG